MISFVNAKINIGLQIVGKRPDGYHDLQTVFYPVGLYAGMPSNPESFSDILEIIPIDRPGIEYDFTGKIINCPKEKNLVCRAAELYADTVGLTSGARIILDKHLPDGAGMGGGSADASFTLRMMNDLLIGKEKLSKSQLAEMAIKLGADCPFFIYNKPMYATGVGEKLESIDLDLSGLWLVVIKPNIYVSTKEAFSGITPHPGNVNLRTISADNIADWQSIVKNDFEESLFPLHPELSRIKDQLLSNGALYASMTGSGSSIYGIFADKNVASATVRIFKNSTTIEGSYLLKL